MNTATETRQIEIPFPGFYESELSALLDSAEEMEAYSISNQGGDCPENEGVSQNDVAAALFDSMDYGKARDLLARDYVSSFVEIARSELSRELPLEFAELVSPREYNFGTDRVFITAPLLFVRVMREAVKPETLAAVIAERHTSYSGFHSFYSNNAEDWNAKPIDEWDANELSTLLRAYLRDAMEAEGETEERFSRALLDYMHESGWEVVDAANNWAKFEAALAELRAAAAPNATSEHKT